MRLNNSIKKLFSVFCLLQGIFALNNLFALKVPELRGHVNDYANIIKSNDENQIESFLKSIEDKTSAQIAVLTLKSLDDEDLESFSLKVAETWKLGKAGKDNGVLLLVSMDEHAVRIETGYGAEEFLTDAKCGLIIRNIIVPEFQKGDYSTGIKNAVENIGGILTQDESLIDSSVLKENSTEEDYIPDSVEIILCIIIIIISLIIYFSPGKHGRYGRGGYRRGYGSGSSFHSGGHSGFSGGGGHFGGGGASGHW